VDDEPVARAGLRTLLERDTEFAVVGEAGDGHAAVMTIQELQPDVVLLDVQMPEMNGFQVLAAIGPSQMPLVVFTTAHEEFALDAFDVNAIDYLLKPFDDERFGRAMARVKRMHQNEQTGDVRERLAELLAHPGVSSESEGHVKRLMVKTGGRVYFLRTDEIDWIEAADYYVKVHAGGDTHLMRRTLQSLVEVLRPEQFVRAHRSAIVNVDRIAEIRPYSRRVSLLVLRDGTEIRLSQHRREALEARLSGTESTPGNPS
jgi:two-component system LytT family response regulator